MADCPRDFWWFGGCKFEARYDIGPAEVPANVSRLDDADDLYHFRRLTYVRDVCVRCGRTIERPHD